jgi:hypothetical protein
VDPYFEANFWCLQRHINFWSKIAEFTSQKTMFGSLGSKYWAEDNATTEIIHSATPLIQW